MRGACSFCVATGPLAGYGAGGPGRYGAAGGADGWGTEASDGATASIALRLPSVRSTALSRGGPRLDDSPSPPVLPVGTRSGDHPPPCHPRGPRRLPARIAGDDDRVTPATQRRGARLRHTARQSAGRPPAPTTSRNSGRHDDADRHPRGLQRDAGQRQGGRVRLPGHQLHVARRRSTRRCAGFAEAESDGIIQVSTGGAEFVSGTRGQGHGHRRGGAGRVRARRRRTSTRSTSRCTPTTARRTSSTPSSAR